MSWTKKDFRGRTALLQEKNCGVARKSVGISIAGRRPARDGSTIFSTDSRELGYVTSGNFSPTLGHCIALALVDDSVQLGDAVLLDVRGTLLEGRVVTTPFVPKKKV